MCNNYTPEELDSYWQKVVKDALTNSIKIEKKLENALRNQRKLNRSLGKIRFSAKKLNSGTTKCKTNQKKKKVSESNSDSSIDDDESPQEKNRKTEKEKNKTPERPLLGNGSLEKMKKSQNSFNVEPMDAEEDEMDYEESEAGRKGGLQDRKIQYLHLKDKNDFQKRDSDSSISPEIIIKRNLLQEPPNITHMDSRQYPGTSSKEAAKVNDPANKVEGLMMNIKRYNSDLEKRVQLALAKRSILNENLKATSIGCSSNKVKVKRSVMKQKGKRKSKQVLSPFIKFYLEVYKELCHMHSEKDITEEATRRWWSMSARKRASYGKQRRR